MPAFPVSSLDPFADDFLAAPYPFYAELREAGPVVWLERYGLWACAPHAEVQAALTDWHVQLRGRTRPCGTLEKQDLVFRVGLLKVRADQ